MSLVQRNCIIALQIGSPARRVAKKARHRLRNRSSTDNLFPATQEEEACVDLTAGAATAVVCRREDVAAEVLVPNNTPHTMKRPVSRRPAGTSQPASPFAIAQVTGGNWETGWAP